jgi:hypothetical protein
MPIAEGRGHGEVTIWYGGERFIYLPYLLGLRVEPARIHIGVANAILITTSDAEYHLHEHVHLGHAFEVLHADRDVLLQGLLRQIQLVRGEERLAVRRKVLLSGLHHAIEPWQPRLQAVVRVQNPWHAI